MSRAKAKGTAWETACVVYLRANGAPHAERRIAGSAADRGDLAGVPGVVWQSKDHGELRPGPWLEEVEVQRRNDGADIGVVWAKRRGKASAADGIIILSPDTLVRLLRAAGYLTPPPEGTTP